MRVVLLGDLHLGARNDSSIVSNYQIKFFEDVLFPYLKKHKINTVIQAGDLFDRRKFTNHVILEQWKTSVFDVIEKNKINFHTVLGNHDVVFKNKLVPNSPQLFLSNYKHITIYDNPTEVEFDNTKFAMIPWICMSNESKINEMIKSTDAHYCVGHFEFGGFEMYKGQMQHEGMEKNNFKRFDMVFSGHYHTRSNDGHIYYLGTPYELTWADYNDPRGFYVFDTKTLDLEFIKNPYTMFNKIEYDDKDKGTDYNKTFDMLIPDLKESYVKVVVVNKTDPYEFDKLMTKLYNANTADLKVIEDMSDYDATSIDDEDLKMEDTMTLVESYIDSLDVELDVKKLKGMVKTLYVEALSVID